MAVLAPVFAELLQAYLGDLGGLPGLLFFVVFLAPLYGGAALLVREVSVRTGRGWPGRLLLATAFGVAMPTLVDASLFTPHSPDIAYWDQLQSAATVGGISVYAAITWVGGHVLMSIAAPLVVVESLVGDPRPWLGRIGLGVVTVLMVAVAAAVHADLAQSHDVHVSVRQYAVSAAVVAASVGLAFTPLGRPVRRTTGSAPEPWVCAVVGFVLMAGFDLVPMSWLGVAIDVAALAVGGALVLRWCGSPAWRPRHVAALAFGGVLARTLIGFLAPLPAQTTVTDKLTQNVLYLALVLALGVALARRTRQ